MRFKFQSLHAKMGSLHDLLEPHLTGDRGGHLPPGSGPRPPAHQRARRRDHRAGGAGAGHPRQPGEGLRGPADQARAAAVRATASANQPTPAAAVDSSAGAGVRRRRQAPRLEEAQLQAFFRKYSEAHLKALGTPPKATADQLRAKLEKLLAGQRLDKVELDVSVDDGQDPRPRPPAALAAPPSHVLAGQRGDRPGGRRYLVATASVVGSLCA